MAGKDDGTDPILGVSTTNTEQTLGPVTKMTSVAGDATQLVWYLPCMYEIQV